MAIENLNEKKIHRHSQTAEDEGRERASKSRSIESIEGRQWLLIQIWTRVQCD